MDVSTAVKQRISTRAFLDTPLPKAEVEQWLKDASRSPSGGNLQPWRVIALGGEEKQKIVDMAASVLAQNPQGEPTDRPIYPDYITDAQKARRFRVGEMMYEKVGIPREDKMARMMWFSRNFRFFDAPLALFFVLDERVGHGQWGHTGMLMQTLALLAEERGWATCMQECWGILRLSLKEALGLAEHEMVWCGMAVGIPDKSDPVNELYTERASLDEWVEFKGL
ncbi:nitroreductase [Hyphomonas sp. FCG-A18]|uniref:nitroreductase n=1 Tax=Hyphomonas sp. FCG-A18 TaxID=3080019 RepID=UPI002B2B3B6E|nr:nitroreductase [Hyphomonas sp. FCG-A18]